MSETKPANPPDPPSQPGKSGNECFLCSRTESGAWHYVASLGRFVCETCYRRAMSRPTPNPAKR
jgi:hypothetical protein